MPEARFNNKGVALLIVLATLLVVASQATIILSMILSHSRFTQAQTGRIQAYYAAMSGINYALEQLRTGNWEAGTDCPDGSPCTMTFDSGDFRPTSITGNSVSITIIPYGSAGCTVSPGDTTCVTATATYTYTP